MSEDPQEAGSSGAPDAADLASFAREIPYPMLRAGPDGTLVFGNDASLALQAEWGVKAGDRLPAGIAQHVKAALDSSERRRIEQPAAGRLFRVVFDPIAGSGYCNLYALDITEQRAFEEQISDLARFPDENPNPVMRVDAEGKVTYANESAQLILDEWGVGASAVVPTDVFDLVRQAMDTHTLGDLEVSSHGRVFSLNIAPAAATRYANLYGRDLTRQKDAERSLIEARDAALEASRAKSAFLANMSHELRTPMNAIIGYSEMLMEEVEARSLEGLTPDLQRIHAAGRHLLDLINDILDLSKIEAGRMSVYLESIEMSDLLGHVRGTIEALATKSGNEFQVERACDISALHTDVTKVRQILLNLLSNAFKFTKQGKVILRVEDADLDGQSAVRFVVRDSGIGMSKEQLSRIYTSFTQADESTTREFGGTGLGLTITKRFSEMLGGVIEVESEPGVGSTFIVTLPVMTKRRSELPPAPDASRPPSTLPAQVDGHPVLVVDDDPNVRDILRSTLTKAGLSVVTAGTGQEALKLARELQPTAITLDVIMPEMDGWTVLGKLKHDELTRDIPVVIVSISDDRTLGFALGATDFMTKPIDRKRLVEVIRRLDMSRDSWRLLLVEDEVEMRELMRRTLEKVGWSVFEAENGKQALDALERERPDAVILDLMMPVMNGFQFLESLRADVRFRRLPVVVVTAMELSGEEREYLRGTVERVLEKGSMPRDTLLGEIRDVVIDSIASPSHEASP